MKKSLCSHKSGLCKTVCAPPALGSLVWLAHSGAVNQNIVGNKIFHPQINVSLWHEGYFRLIYFHHYC